MIDRDKIKELSELSMMEIKDDEIEFYMDKVNNILKNMENIKDIDVDGVEYSYNPNDKINPLRKDIVDKSMSSEEVLQNTEEKQYGYFKILRVMD